MKTDIIHLESFDDIDSIRDRLEWSKADRLVLVWPRRRSIKISQLDMALLVRKAAHLGRQIAIVNGGEEVRNLAIAAGIPVFHSQASATLARWPRLPEEIIEPVADRGLKEMRDEIERLREADQATPPLRKVPFIIGVAAVFLLIIFFMPGATIHIYPAEIPQTIGFSIRADADINQADISGFIPLRSLTSLQSYQEQIETSGQVPLPDQFARGHVNLTNRTSGLIAIPEGTVVTTQSDAPVRFRILSSVEIPAGGEDDRVGIEAVLPGSSGNVAEYAILSMEGPLGMSVAVRNHEPTTGGDETVLRSPSEDDVETLREKVKSILLAQGREEILRSAEPGVVFLEDSLKIEKIVDEQISTPAGQPADTLEISLTGEIRMNYILEEDARMSCRSALNASLPAGYAPVDDDIHLTMTGEPSFDRGTTTATWNVAAARRLRSTYSTRTIIQAVTGQPVKKATETISGLVEFREPPGIEMRPGWWPRLPFLPFRIEVEAD